MDTNFWAGYNLSFDIVLVDGAPVLVASNFILDVSQFSFIGTEKPALYVAGNLTNFVPDSFSKLVVLTGGAVETVSDTLTATPTFTFDIGGAIPNIENIIVQAGVEAHLRHGATNNLFNYLLSPFGMNYIGIEGNLILDGNETMYITSCLAIAADTVYIGPGGLLSATGYSPGNGDSPQTVDSTATHAGSSCDSGSPNQNGPIGNFMYPILMGSGGGYGSLGGGNIQISARNITNLGNISVDAVGNAAAGSIYLSTQMYSGTGILSATSTFAIYNQICTADGRIALIYNSTYGPGPADDYYKTSTYAGTYYQQDVGAQTSLVYLNQRIPYTGVPAVLPVNNAANLKKHALSDPQPAPLPPRDLKKRSGSAPSTIYVNSVWFNGETNSYASLSTLSLSSVDPMVESSFSNYEILTLTTGSETCSGVENENCTIQNKYLLHIESTGEGSLIVAGVLINWAVIVGSNLNVVGTMYLRVGFLDLATDTDNMIQGYYPGAVIVDEIDVNAGGQIIFDQFLGPYHPIGKRFLYVGNPPRAYIHAISQIKLIGGSILSDGTGGTLQDAGSDDCYGGGSYGIGGGDDFSDAYLDPLDYPVDRFNPTEPGLGPGSCNETIESLQTYGGGAIHIVTRKLDMTEGARISAEGVDGGGGGAIWIQAKEIDVSPDSIISVNGSNFPNLPVCGAGGRLAIYTSSNTSMVAPVSYSPQNCPYEIAPSNGSFVQEATYFYFISQTLVSDLLQNEFVTDPYFIRFGQVNLLGHTPDSYYMPDNYMYTIIPGNTPATVQMDSWNTVNENSDYSPGTVRIVATANANNDLVVQITFFADWFSDDYLLTNVQFSFALLRYQAEEYYPQPVPDTGDGYIWYAWNSNNLDDFALNRYTAVSKIAQVDGVDQPCNATIGYDSFLHVNSTPFTNNVTITFFVRLEVADGPQIALVVPETTSHLLYPGDVIDVVGSGFNFMAATQVTLNGESLRILDWSSTQITTILPAFASDGDIQVIFAQGGNSTGYHITVTPRPSPVFGVSVTGISWGDPHFVKFSGDTFNFQGFGEYVLAKVADVEIQTRQEPCNTGVNCNAAVAVKSGSSLFSVYHTDLRTYVNHNLVTLNQDNAVSSNMSIHKTDSEYVITTPKVIIEIDFWGWFDVHVTIRNTTADNGNGGLLGDMSLLWKWQNGTSTRVTSQGDVNSFGESWRVTSATSLFEYYGTSTYAAQNQPSYTPIDFPTFNDTDLESSAKDLCAAIYNSPMTTSVCKDLVAQIGNYYVACVDDIAATKDITLAERSIAALAVACASNSTQDLQSITTVPILATYTQAFGPGVTTVVANIPSNFTIQTNNALGKKAHDYSVQFNVTITVPGTQNSLFDHYDGTYTQTYTATQVGTYYVYVYITTATGQQLPIFGSPFKVSVLSEATCVSWGDPHLTTYMGHQFNFQGYGEYVLAQANNAQVQVRQQPCNPGVTCNFAVVAADANNTLALYSINNQLTAVINGQNLPSPFNYSSTTASIKKISVYEYDITLIGKLTVKTLFYGRLDLTVVVPTTVAGFRMDGGLCGTASGAWVVANGTRYAGASYDTNQGFLHDFGETWRVSQNASLFNYNVTSSNYTSQNPTTYPSNYTTNTTEPQYTQATSTCALLIDGGNLAEECRSYVDFMPYYTACVFDVVASRDALLAQSSIVAYSTICSQYLNSSTGAYPTIGSHSYAQGAGLAPAGLIAGYPTTFVVYLVDALGNAQVHAQDTITVQLLSSPTGDLTEVYFAVPDATFGQSQYLVTYEPTNPGQYVFEILVNGQPISNSPITIVASNYNNTYATGPGISSNNLTVVSQTWFTIHAVDGNGNPTNASNFIYSSTGPSNLSFQPGVTSSQGVTNVTYIPGANGTYTISVQTNIGAVLTQIAGSPFQVTVKQFIPCVNDSACPSGSTCSLGACQDVDECKNMGTAACGSGWTCTNLPTSYLCTDVNECLNPRQCQTGEMCVNLDGSYYCQSLTCPHDCSGNGVCVKGTCMCNVQYTGPGCEGLSTPITIVADPIIPQLTVKPVGQDATFVISIKAVRELNTLAQTVREVLLPALTFTPAADNNAWTYTSPHALLTGFSTSNLTIIFSYYPTQHNYTFASQNVTLAPYTLKLGASIQSWPFQNIHNRLALVTESYVLLNGTQCYLPNEEINDPNSNLLWIKNSILGTTLYGHFLQNGVVDGKTVQVSNSYNHSTNESLMILPHFFDSGMLDPDFSVLLDPFSKESQKNDNAADGCFAAIKSHKKNVTTPIVATIFSVLGVAAIVAAVMYFLRRKQRTATKRKLTSASRRTLV